MIEYTGDDTRPSVAPDEAGSGTGGVDRDSNAGRGGRGGRVGVALRSPAGWFCLLVVVVFGIRALVTLGGGASWAAPGTGWRSVWQLAMVALAGGGLAFPARRALCVIAIGAVYAVATLLELAVNGTILIGVIPVDMRDRVIHPLVAVLAVASLIAMVPRLRDARPLPSRLR
ncbi:hypothetical protein [Frankia sp. R82]|uniref:hypothetical protein n=1 Tax=Frankia sp. R82 TaxID=2950553 RepID=UPI0020446107|nr:hypothetical protein [Frankia sp. R82]MCM3882548.1 hypothetical protein [Frankia sp. R82]